MFDKLKEDQYIDVMLINDIDNYFITFNGLLFLQKEATKNKNIINTNLRFKKFLMLFINCHSFRKYLHCNTNRDAFF